MLTRFLALYGREVMRFRKLWLDTIFSPIVSVGLYLGVFGFVAGDRLVAGMPYLVFIYVGLVSMMMINSSFSNPSFALIISKNVGTIVDLQLVPLAPWAIGLAYALAAATRAVATLCVAVLFTIWFIPLPVLAHPFLLVGAIIITGLEFGLLGVVFGMRARNFEALTFMTTFVMQPMIFLAGVFYPVSQLPGIWSKVAQFNPIHHTINILRYSATGFADASPIVSVVVVLVITGCLLWLSHAFTKKSLYTV